MYIKTSWSIVILGRKIVTFPCLHWYFDVTDQKGHVPGSVKVCLVGTSWWPLVILSGWLCLANARGLDYHLPDVQPLRWSGLHEQTTDGLGSMLSYSFKIRHIIARQVDKSAASPDHPGKPECKSWDCSVNGDHLREPDPADGWRVCLWTSVGASFSFLPVTSQSPSCSPTTLPLINIIFRKYVYIKLLLSLDL